MAQNLFYGKGNNKEIVVSPDKVRIFGVMTAVVGGRWHTTGLEKRVVHDTAPYRAEDAIRLVLNADRTNGTIDRVTRLVIGPFIAVALLLEESLRYGPVLDGEVGDYRILHLHIENGSLVLAGHPFQKVEVWSTGDPFAIVTCDDSGPLYK